MINCLLKVLILLRNNKKVQLGSFEQKNKIEDFEVCLYRDFGKIAIFCIFGQKW